MNYNVIRKQETSSKTNHAYSQHSHLNNFRDGAQGLVIHSYFASSVVTETLILSAVLVQKVVMSFCEILGRSIPFQQKQYIRF